MANQTPTIRATSEEIESIYELYAARTALQRAMLTMWTRVLSVPYGRRDLRQLHGTLSRLTQKLLETFPVEKQAAIHRMLPNCHFRVIKGVEACNMSPEEIIITHAEFDTLARAAHEQCKLCARQDCRRCPLGRTLDKVLVHDRDGGSWANVDL